MNRLIALSVVSLVFSSVAMSSGVPSEFDELVKKLQELGEEYQEKYKGAYPTHGVHSNYLCFKLNNHCIAPRNEGDPSDPLFPSQWISDWTMFRVMTNYEDNPPPYTNPPSTLAPSDYTVSYGTTYYDATYIPADGDGSGAMMEHYDSYCLPIFPIADNNYSCSFISLGNKAYFLTYDDRPDDMPPICLFSPLNHPPRQDFIKHLDYSSELSQQLNGSIQAYVWQSMLDQGGPLFGYAFNSEASPDTHSPVWYRHPQSFFFSGDTTKANAPIVSQNYTSFRAETPDPRVTWDQVTSLWPQGDMPECHLFDR